MTSRIANMFRALAVVIGTGSVLTLPYIAKQAAIVAQGNAAQYSVAQTEALPNSPLKSKTIVFLGSSVTAGSAAYGESFMTGTRYSSTHYGKMVDLLL